MKQQADFLMLAKTFKGLEEVLAQELIELGANDVQLERRAVSFRGDKALLYRANLCLRTAIRILVPIASFKVKDTDALYNQVKAQGSAGSAGMVYDAMPEAERASNCVACGLCKTRCPQKIDIPAQLKKTVEVFASRNK